MFTLATALVSLAGASVAAPLASRQLIDRCPFGGNPNLTAPVNIISESTNELVWTPIDLNQGSWTRMGLTYNSRASGLTLWHLNATGDRYLDGYNYVSIVPYSYDGSYNNFYATSSPRTDDIISADNGSPVPVDGPFTYDVYPYDWNIICDTCSSEGNLPNATGCYMQQGETGNCATVVEDTTDAPFGYDVILTRCDVGNLNQSFSIGLQALN